MLESPAVDIQTRIIESGTARPIDLAANPRNFRAHPEAQRQALEAALIDIGWISPVIVNKRTGLILDGHLRVAVALHRREAEVPVDWVDLTEEEEGAALATLDPITAMAKANPHLYGRLLQVTATGNEDLMAYLSAFAERIGVDRQNQEREQTGARELSPDDFGHFTHECPECGFKFD